MNGSCVRSLCEGFYCCVETLADLSALSPLTLRLLGYRGNCRTKPRACMGCFELHILWPTSYTYAHALPVGLQYSVCVCVCVCVCVDVCADPGQTCQKCFIASTNFLLYCVCVCVCVWLFMLCFLLLFDNFHPLTVTLVTVSTCGRPPSFRAVAGPTECETECNVSCVNRSNTKARKRRRGVTVEEGMSPHLSRRFCPLVSPPSGSKSSVTSNILCNEI